MWLRVRRASNSQFRIVLYRVIEFESTLALDALACLLALIGQW